MPTWTTALPDWEQRLLKRQSIIPAPIYPNEAGRALDIFKQLRVTDLPGKPTFGECSEQWVFDFVAAVFGAYDADTGKQLIREYGLLISKKNTKSTIAAGIMLTALIMCWREEEEHLILAPTKEVADNSFKPAAAMIRSDDELSAMFHIQDHVRTITHRVMRSSLKVVAADTDTVSGKKAGRILVDELWVFGKKANAEAMFMEALGGQVSREEGWVIYLTTQSDEPPSGVFKERLNYWRDVRDGKIQDRKTLGILYEFPSALVESKAYLNTENFDITNPNLGRSVSAEWLEDQLKKTQHKTDGTLQQFLAKHLNIEIGLNLRSDRWIGAEFWQDQASETPISLDWLLKNCDVIEVGIDGGGLDDLLGFCVMGRHSETAHWYAWHHAWAHPSVLQRRKQEAARFHDFSKQGTLTLVDRVGTDINEVAMIVSQIYESGLLDKIGVDPSGLGSIVEAIETTGVPNECIVGVSQGWRMTGAIKTTERKLAEGVLFHDGSAMMNWCVSNARVEPRGNAIIITKQAAGSAKIDPLMAMFNAVTLMSMNPESRGGFADYLANPVIA